ncbi:MAG: hypothetical protein A2015_11460 [Spirochaetes bacterium GWF1_31_7]|nr:MAG: hypothetical protein A2Y30_15615 [Spirochaetes bacterium GWE1_32_154]OHD49040.1 MAG: hypothetical protein A2015_11460 [Spirochaetes bacterium GWF1_31_7]OHD50376.1 MAG: hypothetical protein A2Y29_13665 [Spirochaetes bacterium GWE2_31_10]
MSKIRIAVSVFLVLLLNGAYAQNTNKRLLNLKDNNVVKVGKNIITLDELDKTFNEMNNLASVYGKNITKKEVLDLMVDDYIIKDRIKEEKLVLDESMYNQELNMMKYQYSMMKQEKNPNFQFDEAEFKKYIEQEGKLNYVDFEDKIKQKVLVKQFLYKQAGPKLQELARKTFESSREFPVSIPNQQGGVDTFNSLKEIYDQNEESFIQPSMVVLKHIYFRTIDQAGPMNAADKSAIKSRAEDALKLLKAGGDFDTICLRFSDDPTAKELVEDPDTKTKHRGYIGPFPISGKMAKATREKYGDVIYSALSSLQKGKMTDIVESQYGYHIFYAVNKKDKSFVAYEEAKSQIVQQLKSFEEQTVVQNTYLDLIKDLRKKTDINYFMKEYE